MSRIKIKAVLGLKPEGQEITVKGWVRTFRNNQFIALNDGSTNNNLQVVVELGLLDEAIVKRITTGAAISATGKTCKPIKRNSQHSSPISPTKRAMAKMENTMMA